MKFARVFPVVTLATILAACGEAPTTPARPDAGGAGISADETNQGLTISCPLHAIDPVETMYCTTTYNGTNVTASTSFYAMNTAVATAGPGGFVDAVAVGSTLIWASYNGITVSWDLAVVDVTVSISVTRTPYDLESGQEVTFTAVPSQSGSFHYTWKTQYCWMGEVRITCGSWSSGFGGQNLSSVVEYLDPSTRSIEAEVMIRRTAGGPILATHTQKVVNIYAGM